MELQMFGGGYYAFILLSLTIFLSDLFSFLHKIISFSKWQDIHIPSSYGRPPLEDFSLSVPSQKQVPR